MIANQRFEIGNGKRKAARGPLGCLLDFFSSVWVGIFWLAMLFLYCSIGSAVPQVRELPGLEMTEFEWFNWWPFLVLIGLFGTSLIVVTLRKIPLKIVNFGVWTIHTGIIVLVIGSYVYFSQKIEGDAPVFRRNVKIELPGMDKPAKLVALPGSETAVRLGKDIWNFQIQDTNPAWPILSDEHKGEKTYAVNVLVSPPNGQQAFIRQLLSGCPQYTEDIIPGRGRAVKATGKKLIEDDLRLSLDYEPTEYFHLQDTSALFVRRVGDTEWVERPIKRLPRFHDCIASREQVFFNPSEPPELRPIDLAVPATENDALKGASVRVTGFLTYAEFRRRWHDGGDRLNPVVKVSVISDKSDAKSYELAAFDRSMNQAESGAMEFVWLENPAMVESLPTDIRAKLIVSVPSANVRFERVLTADSVSAGGPLTRIEGTDISYRIKAIQDDLFTEAGPVSVAMVEIETPEKQFTRMVAYPPDRTKDMVGEADPHSGHGRAPQPPDPSIVMTYQPAGAPVILAAHPGGLHLAVNGGGGRVLSRSVTIGEIVDIVPGLSLRVDGMWTNAVSEMKPYVVPPRERQAKVNSLAMIKLEIDTGSGVQTKWLRYNSHALPNEQYDYRGRLAFLPEKFRMADGNWVEVMYSREREKLRYPVALEDFELQTHIGGYTGNALTIANYVCRLKFLQPGGSWAGPITVALNDPQPFGDYWYFQSYWDPPSGNAGGGMNYTGLGVGNRHGVHVQLAGCCIAVAGMLYAFYVKPIVKRRRAGQATEQGARIRALSASKGNVELDPNAELLLHSLSEDQP